MAKKKTFADKTKKKKAASTVNVKYVKAVKSDKGSYKFQEKFIKLDDINKVNELK